MWWEGEDVYKGKIQRWRKRWSVNGGRGPDGDTHTKTDRSGYRDQNVPGLAAPDWNNRSVEAYSLWDLTGSYQINKQVRLRAGVINLLDTAPPFTNQSRYFQVTWDPTYGDPRGRTLFASGNVSLR